MRLYIIRHADPDYPNNTITPQGHLEGAALARRLAAIGLDRIYCSPMGRALETARYTREAVGLPLMIEDWLAELPDDWCMSRDPHNGLVAWDLPGEVIRAEAPYPTHDTWHEHPFYQGLELREKFERLCRDSDAFIARHGYERDGGRYRIVRPNRERIAVFCHNGLGLTWLAHLLAMPLSLFWSAFWQAPSAVTTVLFDERSPEWAVPRCLGLGDIGHLHAAGLSPQPRGIQANWE
jgi:broad specificity phosphatase PhoE